jgi:TfoX/Sxy family transcriptional regulator of competence genes
MEQRVAKDPRARYDELAKEYLRRPDVTVGRALQNDVLNVNGKIFAFLSKDRLVVKVPVAQAHALVDSGRAEPFQSGGRTMREWVAVAPSDRQWRRLMNDAIEYVGGLSRSGRTAPRGSGKPSTRSP